MSNVNSYLKANYGRGAGKWKVTRFFKIDVSGRLSYVEKRVPKDIKQETQWKIGNNKYFNVTQSQILASDENEYTENLNTALKQIT